MNIPLDLLGNKRYRVGVLLKAEGNPELQAYLIEKCRRDILFWFDVFAWTYDPRLNGNDRYLPFVLYPFQRDFVSALVKKIEKSKDGETMVIEKCRDMGLTWMVLAVFFHRWLFFNDESFLVGSRKESFVDKHQQPDTLFGKLRILIQKTPKWMRPLGFDPYKHMNHMSLENPETKSIIKGESSNPDFSRSGRYKSVLMDEAAFWDHLQSAHSAASETCNLIITLSTPNPEGSGYFKSELVDMADKEQRYEKVRLDYTMHPKKKDPGWLAEQYRKKSPEIIAVEILMDYMGAIKGKVYARAMQCLVDQKYAYDPGLPLYRAWDFGHGGGDATAIIWFQKDLATNQIRMIDCYQKAEEDINFFAAIAKGDLRKALESTFQYSDEDIEGIKRRILWKQVEADFGDPYDANTRTFVNYTTLSKELARHDIHIQIRTGTSVNDRIEKARLLLKRLVVHPNAQEALLNIAKARFPTVAENTNATSPRNKPVHDETSHYRTALEYFADNEPDAPEQDDGEEEILYVSGYDAKIDADVMIATNG